MSAQPMKLMSVTRFKKNEAVSKSDINLQIN